MEIDAIMIQTVLGIAHIVTKTLVSCQMIIPVVQMAQNIALLENIVIKLIANILKILEKNAHLMMSVDSWLIVIRHANCSFQILLERKSDNLEQSFIK